MNEPEPESRASAGASMGGITRMHDPSELAHDRVRRKAMNLAFLALLIPTALDFYFYSVTPRRALLMLGWIIAAMPFALVVRGWEMRFKIASEELRRLQKEIPFSAARNFVAYFLLWFAALCVLPMWPQFESGVEGVNLFGPDYFYFSLVCALWGIWLADFYGYYRHRPERMRHLYMITATLDDVRRFKWVVLAPVPSLTLEAWLLLKKTL